MRLALRGFMSHSASQVALPDRGVVMIVGPNGAGKSAVVEGVSVALWGRGLRGSRWSPWWPDKPGSVCLDLGDLVAERGWTGKAKTPLTFGVLGGEGTTFDTTSKAQAALDAIVGTHESWRRTSVFSSADAAHFTMASDVERKALLEELLGVTWMQAAHDAARKDLRAAKLAHQQAELRGGLAQAKIDSLRSGVVRLEETLRGLPQVVDDTSALVEVNRLSNMLRAAADACGDADTRLRKIASVGGRDEQRAQDARSKLTKLSADTCFTCGQEITEVMRASIRREVQAALDAAQVARAAVADEEAKLKADADELDEEADGLRAMLATAKAQAAQAAQAKATLARCAQQIAEAGAEVSQAMTSLADAERDAATLLVDIAELEACDEVLGPRGARARVVGATLATIEANANRWLSRLSSSIRVGLKPYTERKSGAVAEAISLVLQGAGGESGYQGASAGERRRVDVALLLALAQLASRAQTSWRSPVFFDELFDSLDELGREAVGELVRELAEDRLVVVITHDEAVASVRADLRLRIDGGVVT